MILENNAFQKYYRTSVSKVATGVYKYIGSTTSNASVVSTINNKFGELKSGTDTNPTGTTAYEFYTTYHASGTDSGVAKGVNATSTNTYTKRYDFQIDKRNKILTNGVYNASNKPDYTYSRVVESNSRFVNYHRTVISCIHSGNNVYKYTGTNTTIKNRYGYLKSGSATAPTGDVTYEIYVTHNASGTDSDVAKGYSADASNTYTKRYSFQLDKYNSVKDNGTYNASSAPDFDYSRVVESNTRFVNYLRNPLLRTSSYRVNYNTNITFDIKKHISGQNYLSDYYLYRYWETVECDGDVLWKCEDVNGYVTYGYLTYTIDKYNDTYSVKYTETNEHTHQSWQGHKYPSGGEPYNINEYKTTDPSTWTYS